MEFRFPLLVIGPMIDLFTLANPDTTYKIDFGTLYVYKVWVDNKIVAIVSNPYQPLKQWEYEYLNAAAQQDTLPSYWADMCCDYRLD
jgi:hypothetical protein